MSRSLSSHWDDKLVKSYLEDAAAIHRRLPAVRVPGYFTLWPEILKDDWTRLYDQVNGKSYLGSPMPPEVTYQEEVMEWLRLLSPQDQQIVWMRANRIPWKILVAEFDRSKSTLWRRTRYCHLRIAARLNAIDPEGIRFRRLGYRTGETP